jgi:hypothetical protein
MTPNRTNRPVQSPAYYRGRSAAAWRKALAPRAARHTATRARRRA